MTVSISWFHHSCDIVCKFNLIYAALQNLAWFVNFSHVWRALMSKPSNKLESFKMQRECTWILTRKFRPPLPKFLWVQTLAFEALWFQNKATYQDIENKFRESPWRSFYLPKFDVVWSTRLWELAAKREREREFICHNSSRKIYLSSC